MRFGILTALVEKITVVSEVTPRTGVTLLPLSRQYSVGWDDDAWVTNSEGSGRKWSWPDRDTIAAFAWRN